MQAIVEIYQIHFMLMYIHKINQRITRNYSSKDLSISVALSSVNPYFSKVSQYAPLAPNSSTACTSPHFFPAYYHLPFGDLASASPVSRRMDSSAQETRTTLTCLSVYALPSQRHSSDPVPIRMISKRPLTEL